MRGWWEWQREWRHGCIGDGYRVRNLPGSSTKLCLGGFVYTGTFYAGTESSSRSQQADQPSHQKELPAKGWAWLISVLAEWCLCILITKARSTTLCVAYTAGKMELRWLWKGPHETLARGRSKFNTFGAVPQMLKQYLGSKSENLGKLFLQDYNRDLF